MRHSRPGGNPVPYPQPFRRARCAVVVQLTRYRYEVRQVPRRANDFFTMAGAMATAVLRCGHVFSTIHMPTPGYQREHGTPK